MRFVSVPLRDLLRRPLRSLLTMVGIVGAVGAFVALVGFSRGIERGCTHSIRRRGTHLVALRRGAIQILPASLDETLLPRLRQFPGVADAAAEVADLVTLETGDAALLIAWAPDSYLWNTLELRDGRLPVPGGQPSVVLGHELAALLGKRPGDSLSLLRETFQVTGIATSEGVLQGHALFLLLGPAQEALGRQGKITAFHLRLEHPDDPAARAAVKQGITAAFPDLTPLETEEVVSSNRMFQAVNAMSWGTITVALGMALVITLNTLLMSVTERTREIGILRAVGWRPGRILAMTVLEGLALTTVGSALGILVGMGALEALRHAPIVAGFLEPAVDLRLLAEVASAALALGILGSLYPAWRAIRLNPVDALRHE